ncbi:hypothetical protein SAMN05444680_1256 [Variovorax sp. YR216]|nr:hypothetical protein SAMN05444680_1256 [Variovorax sp. YR216]
MRFDWAVQPKAVLELGSGNLCMNDVSVRHREVRNRPRVLTAVWRELREGLRE